MKIIAVIKEKITCKIPLFFFLMPLVWIGLLLFIPLITMILESFYDTKFTLGIYTKFLNILYFKVIIRSLFLATASAFFTLFIGYPVAYFLAFAKIKYKNFFIFLLTLPFWTNLIIQVYAWFFILEKTGLINMLFIKLHIIDEPIQFAYNWGAIIVLMVYCYLPFMIMPLYTMLQKFDTRLLEASMDLGATRWQTFLNITWPLSLSGVRAGFLLVFVPAFGDFIIPSLVGGSRYLTVGSLISYYFLTAQDRSSGAAFTVISGLVLMISVAIVTMLLTPKKI